VSSGRKILDAPQLKKCRPVILKFSLIHVSQIYCYRRKGRYEKHAESVRKAIDRTPDTFLKVESGNVTATLAALPAAVADSMSALDPDTPEPSEGALGDSTPQEQAIPEPEKSIEKPKPAI